MTAFGFEARKVVRAHRPLIAGATLVFFLTLMLFGFYTYAMKETGGRADFRYTYENDSYFNGLTFALYAFYYGFVLVLPIFAATEGGVQIAGETSSRTLHLLLARPVSRWRIFGNKLAVAAAYLFLLVGGLLALTLGAGLVFVGWGDLDLYPGILQMTDSHQFLPRGEALVRFLFVWPAASVSLLATLSLSLLLSAWMRSPVNAVGTSVALYLVLYVISEIHFFADLRPYLFTTYVGYWRGLFQENVAVEPLLRDAAKLLAFTCLFLWLAFRRFRRREESS